MDLQHESPAGPRSGNVRKVLLRYPVTQRKPSVHSVLAKPRSLDNSPAVVPQGLKFKRLTCQCTAYWIY